MSRQKNIRSAYSIVDVMVRSSHVFYLLDVIPFNLWYFTSMPQAKMMIFKDIN